MTISIVTTTPMVPTTSTEDTSGRASDSGSAFPGLDFASLLLGQLVPVKQSTQSATTIEETTTEEALVEEATPPADNAAAFAALTLAPQVSATSTTPEAPEASEGESPQTTTGSSKDDATPLPLLPTAERLTTFEHAAQG